MTATGIGTATAGGGSGTATAAAAGSLAERQGGDAPPSSRRRLHDDVDSGDGDDNGDCDGGHGKNFGCQQRRQPSLWQREWEGG